MSRRVLSLVLLVAVGTSPSVAAQSSEFAAEMAKAEAALQADAFDEAITAYSRS
jgi:hypothetical protein